MFEPAFLRPQNSVNLHPIETGDYLIGTPSTFEFFTIVRKWLDTSQPGGLVFGPPRFGKTRAIRYISRQLQSEFAGTLPILNYPRFRNRADFYCVAIGIGLKMRKEIDSIDSFSLCRNRSKTFLREESWILRSALPIKTSPRGVAWP